MHVTFSFAFGKYYMDFVGNLVIFPAVTQGKFPSLHKSAIVRPRLKKPHLDASDLSSYRPISNLSFVSKILERM